MESTRKPRPNNYGHRILEILSEGDYSPSEIAERLDSTYQTINNYMRNLRDENFVETKNKGKEVHYSLNDRGKELLEIMNKEKQLKEERKQLFLR